MKYFQYNLVRNHAKILDYLPHPEAKLLEELGTAPLEHFYVRLLVRGSPMQFHSSNRLLHSAIAPITDTRFQRPDSFLLDVWTDEHIPLIGPPQINNPTQLIPLTDIDGKTKCHSFLHIYTAPQLNTVFGTPKGGRHYGSIP